MDFREAFVEQEVTTKLSESPEEGVRRVIPVLPDGILNEANCRLPTVRDMGHHIFREFFGLGFIEVAEEEGKEEQRWGSCALNVGQVSCHSVCRM